MKISARQWNEMLERRRRNRLLAFILNLGTGWLHPWQVLPQWDPVAKQWVVTIKTGFVNSLCPTVSMPVDLAPQRTLDRLQSQNVTPGALVDSFLTDLPLWPLTSFRSVGADATPTGVNENNDGSVSFNYEGVPKFFASLGVGAAPQVTAGNDSGLVATSPTTDQSNIRLLRACDIVLHQDHIATVGQVTVGSAVAGTVVQVNATYVNPPRKRPYLTQESKYTPSVVSDDPFTAATQGWSDLPSTSALLATVWMVSPPGTGFQSAPDGTWTPYLQHAFFWSCDFGTNVVTQEVAPQQLSLNTGLAAGVGDAVNNYLLGQVNDEDSALTAFLNNNRYAGRFYTV